MNAMRSLRGSLNLFVATSSKHKGVRRNSFMALWYSAATSHCCGMSSKFVMRDRPEPVGFSCKKSPRWITIGMRPNAPERRLYSLSCKSQRSRRPRKEQ